MECAGHNKSINCKDCSKTIRKDKLSSHIFSKHRDKIQAHIRKVGKIIIPVEYNFQYLCMTCHKSFTSKAKALKHIELNNESCSVEAQTIEIVSLVGMDISNNINVTYNTMGVSQKTLKIAQNAVEKYSNKWVNDTVEQKEKIELLTAENNIQKQKIESLIYTKQKCRLAESKLALSEKQSYFDKIISESKIKVLLNFIETQVLFKKLPPYDYEYCKNKIESITYDDMELNILKSLKEEVEYHKDGKLIATVDPEPFPEYETILVSKPTPKPEPKLAPVLEQKKCTWCPGEYEDDLYKCKICNEWKHNTNEAMECYSFDCLTCTKPFCRQCMVKMPKISTKLNPYCSMECKLKDG